MTKKNDKKAACQRRDRRKTYKQARDGELIVFAREIVDMARSKHGCELRFSGLPLDSILYTHYSELLRQRFLGTDYNLSEWQNLVEEAKAVLVSLSFEQQRCVRFTVKIHPELHDRWVSSQRDIKAEIRDSLTKELKALGIEHMPYLFVTEGHCKYRSKVNVHIHGMAISLNEREDGLLHKALGRATGNGTRGRPSTCKAVQVDRYDRTKGWIGYISKSLPRKDDRLGEKRFAFSRKATDMGRSLYNALLGRNPAPLAASVPLVVAPVRLGAASAGRMTAAPRPSRVGYRVGTGAARYVPPTRLAA